MGREFQTTFPAARNFSEEEGAGVSHFMGPCWLHQPTHPFRQKPLTHPHPPWLENRWLSLSSYCSRVSFWVGGVSLPLTSLSLSLSLSLSPRDECEGQLFIVSTRQLVASLHPENQSFTFSVAHFCRKSFKINKSWVASLYWLFILIQCLVKPAIHHSR